MAQQRHVYLVFDVGGWILLHENSPNIRGMKEDVRKIRLTQRVLRKYKDELAVDLQIRRISVRNSDLGSGLTRIKKDNADREKHRGKNSMSRLVGGEITEVSMASWRAALEPRYPDLFKLPKDL